MDKYIKIFRDFWDKINNSYILNPTKKTVVVFFCAAIALIAAVSGVFVIRDASDKNDSTTQSDTTAQILSTALTAEDTPVKANVLFALEGDEKIELLGVMRLDSMEKSVRIAFLNPETYISFNNLSGTMNEHYNNGGATELVWAVGEYAGISIERYVLADYVTFKSLLNGIGDMTVTLDHDVICGQNAASFVIEKGQQTLVPEMMTKYFGYICEDLSSYSDEIAKIMMSFGEKIFCGENENDDKVYKSFEKLISLFKTDISAQDYVNYKPAINSMANKLILQSVVVEQKLSALK